MTEISVVVPTRNRSARLQALLASLAGQRAHELIVVDDASNDDTAEVIVAAGARAIRQPRALGAAAARNRGWREAGGALIVFCDDDVVAQPGWLDAIAAAHGRDADAIVQGCTIPDPREAKRLSAFARSQEASGPGPWFQTCNIAYPRALLERLGGFDEWFALGAGEDTDLGWRAVEAGTRVIYEPAAVNWHAVHEPGALGLIRSAQKWRTAVRNVARHPQLRATLHRGVFWKPSHERLLVAAAGGILALRVASRGDGQAFAAGLGLASALPYLALHRSQHGSYAGTAVALPAHLALDSAEVIAMLRGSVEAGTLVL